MRWRTTAARAFPWREARANKTSIPFTTVQALFWKARVVLERCGSRVINYTLLLVVLTGGENLSLISAFQGVPIDFNVQTATFRIQGSFRVCRVYITPFC